MAELQIIVINYQTPGDLKAFLDSFEAVRAEVDCTLTVVNVCPGPEDHEVVRRGYENGVICDDGWTWLKNVGYNKAANHAASSGSGLYLAIFNADVELRPGVLAGCVAALEENPARAVVGPRQVDESNRITSAGTFGTIENPVMRGWHEYDNGQYADTRDDAVHVSGSAMFWRRSVWNELTACPQFQSAAPGALGALLSTCHHYYGETWAMAHALLHDYLVCFYGPAAAIHKWHRSSPVGGEVELRMPQEKEEFERALKAHAK